MLIVRQQVARDAETVWHVYELPIQLAGGGTFPVPVNMQRDGKPAQSCRQ